MIEIVTFSSCPPTPQEWHMIYKYIFGSKVSNLVIKTVNQKLAKKLMVKNDHRNSHPEIFLSKK